MRKDIRISSVSCIILELIAPPETKIPFYLTLIKIEREVEELLRMAVSRLSTQREGEQRLEVIFSLLSRYTNKILHDIVRKWQKAKVLRDVLQNELHRISERLELALYMYIHFLIVTQPFMEIILLCWESSFTFSYPATWSAPVYIRVEKYLVGFLSLTIVELYLQLSRTILDRK